MSFTFPGQQTVTKAEPTPVRQQGRAVLIRPAAQRTTLAPGAAEKLTLAGKYSGANPLPVEFRLGDATCGVRVSGVAGSTPSAAPPKAATVRGGPGGSGGSGSASTKAKPEKAKPEKPGKGKGPGGGSGKGGK